MNPFAQPPRPIQITIETSPDQLDILELRLEEVALALTRPLDSVSPNLVVLVDAATVTDVHDIIAQVDGAATVREMKLDDIDWVTQVQKDFPPFALGRFYVYGSHAKETLPRNHHPLLIDAVAAFGTGEHATTAGCLLALERVRKRWKNSPSRVQTCVAFHGEPLAAGVWGARPPSEARFSVLDMGCGTAILGIGAARIWKNATVTVADNDPMAVKVSAINLRANQIASRARAHVSDGYRYRVIKQLPPQPVVVANILAKPLMKMAKDAKRTLAPGGTLILSGLLNEQENRVLSAHRAQGLYLKHRLRRGKWSILTVG